MAGPRMVSGALPTATPAAAAAASTAPADSRSMVSGFSPHRCRPDSTTASATSACAAGVVRLTTSSMSSMASSSAAVPENGRPYSAATPAARPVSRSAMPRT